MKPIFDSVILKDPMAQDDLDKYVASENKIFKLLARGSKD